MTCKFLNKEDRCYILIDNKVLGLCPLKWNKDRKKYCKYYQETNIDIIHKITNAYPIKEPFIKKKCKGHMIVIDNGFGTGTVITKCNICGAEDNFNTATRHYYNGCVTN